MVFAIDLIRFSSELLKRLSEVGIKTGDYNYIEMYDNYIDLLNKYGKKNYAKRKVSEHYGPHFNKKLSDFAASKMWKRDANGRKARITPVTKDAVNDVLKAQNITLQNNQLYDAVYVANMWNADFADEMGANDALMAKYIKCVIDDPDACDGTVFNRWYADMCHMGIAVDWEEMI